MWWAFTLMCDQARAVEAKAGGQHHPGRSTRLTAAPGCQDSGLDTAKARQLGL